MIWHDPLVRDAVKGLAILILLPLAVTCLQISWLLLVCYLRGEERPKL